MRKGLRQAQDEGEGNGTAEATPIEDRLCAATDRLDRRDPIDDRNEAKDRDRPGDQHHQDAPEHRLQVLGNRPV